MYKDIRTVLTGPQVGVHSVLCLACLCSCAGLKNVAILTGAVQLSNLLCLYNATGF